MEPETLLALLRAENGKAMVDRHGSSDLGSTLPLCAPYSAGCLLPLPELAESNALKPRSCGRLPASSRKWNGGAWRV
jgi:hypothetical protein